jgi:predicted O-methyltransferase YrrM
MLDAKGLAVLDIYHARMSEERKTRPANPSAAALDDRLLAVGPDTGQLLNILAKSQKAPAILELGTSYGYSAIWLADAARAAGGRLVTMELHDYKSDYARQMSVKAGLAGHVDFEVGDAVSMIAGLPHGIDFVLVDLWKDLYVPCLEALYPKLNAGAIIVADNMILPGGEAVNRYARAVRSKPGMSSIRVPVGSGLEISRFGGD